jgi:inosose dehydratase
MGNNMSEMHLANATCSWGILEFEGMQAERITYAQVLDEVHETGFVGTDLGDWGFMPTEPTALKAELAQRKLAMVSAFLPVALKYPDSHAGGEAEAIKIARLLAASWNAEAGYPGPYLVLADANGTEALRTTHAGRMTPAMGLSTEEWRVFASGAERIAKAVRDETGLETVFHHHCAGYVETPEEIAHLLELTDPSLLGLVFDTGHYLYGSRDSTAALVEEGLHGVAERVKLVHYKDCQPDVARQARAEGWDYFTALQHGVFCELGQGSVPFPAITNQLRMRGYHGWVVVEQDVLPGMGSPKASSARNRAYLKTIGL